MTEREITKLFAEKMADKIEERHNRYQPFAWKTMDIKRLIFLLKKEIDELEEDGSDMKDEAIDIANYACFIYELSKS